MAPAIRLTSLVAVLAAGISTGCSDTVATVVRDESVPLQTDRLSYEAVHVSGEGSYRVYGFELVATFTNHTERTVYLDRCGPTTTTPMFGVLGVGFDAAYDPAWGCVGHNQQFVVGPGQARVDTLRIRGPNRSLKNPVAPSPWGDSGAGSRPAATSRVPSPARSASS